MMNFYEKPKLSPQELLKNQLLDNSIVPTYFLSELEVLDQSDHKHRHAEATVDLLLSDEIVSLFDRSPEHQQYYSFLSFSLFHKAQASALEKDLESVGGFKRALAAEEKAGSEDVTWANYIKGTIAYLMGNVEELKMLVQEKQTEKNKEVLERLVKGLEESEGTPNYRIDYMMSGR